jgi:hypothetical protein
MLGVTENLFERVNQQVTSYIIWFFRQAFLKTKFSKHTLKSNIELQVRTNRSCFKINRSKNQSAAKEDTSETTREAVSKQKNFDFTNYKKHKPSHIKDLDESFLSWFIGLMEGDGSFWTRDTEVGSKFKFENKRAEIEITQHIDNIKLLHYIRTKLGFGRVCIFEKNGNKYCRWCTSRQDHILKLIYLFNGNFVLKKRREKLSELLNQINQVWNLNIPCKNLNPKDHGTGSNITKVSLQNAWLSGFSEADAGFFTNVKTNFKGSPRPAGGHYVKFTTKFYITQLDEEDVLLHIRNLFSATTKISKITNGYTKVRYNRLEIHDASCISLLLQYFSKYPLKDTRNIDLLRLARVHGYKNMHRVVTEKAATKLARLLSNLQEPFSNPTPPDVQLSSTNLEDFSSDFSNEEKTIFMDLPLNQRHLNYFRKKF